MGFYLGRFLGNQIVLGQMDRANTKVFPPQRVSETGLTFETISHRLAFPETHQVAFRRIRIEPVLTLRTNHPKRGGLIFNRLVLQTDCHLLQVAHVY